MKRIFLIIILIIFSFNSFGFSLNPFKKKEVIKPPEIKEFIIKVCYYSIKAGEGVYGILGVFQSECSGIFFAGEIDGMTIIEYGDDLKKSNEQSPTTRDVFHKKIESLWPNLGSIKFPETD